MSGTAKVRAELGATLSKALPKYAVFPAPESLDAVERPTLQLVRTQVKRLPQAPLGAWENTFTLFVIVPMNSPEDTLDEALEDVIEALDTANVHWEDATRDTLGAPGEPCYRLTLTAHSIRKG